MSTDIDDTIRTFENVIAHAGQRLKTGEALRGRLQSALARGEDPNHYRLEWIRSGVLRINNTLLKLAEEFNAAHPDDRCSVQDLGDVLASTLATLKRHAGG